MKARLALTIIATFLAGCSPGGDPQARPALERIPPPMLNGAQAWSISVRNLSVPVVIAGACDQRAIDLEYSLDGAYWQRASSISGADADCSDGRFQFGISSLFGGSTPAGSATATVQVRHVFRVGKGAPALVTVNYTVAKQRLAQGARVVLGHLDGGNASTRVKLRIYARGKVQ